MTPSLCVLAGGEREGSETDRPSPEACLERVKTLDAVEPGYRLRWNRLVDALFTRGGHQVVPPLNRDPFVESLLERGSFFAPPPELSEGDAPLCALNAISLEMDQVIAGAVTGYALSYDNVWRHHCWTAAKSGHVIETSGHRVAYFGVVVADVRFVVTPIQQRRRGNIR
jgi:hypothetical protein